MRARLFFEETDPMKRALILALSGLVATLAAGCGKKEAPAGAPPEVYVADVVQKDVPVYLELVGQTRGSQDVEIRARVEGYLNRVAFTEGAFVRKGELLYQIDPLPLEAALANAKAQLATAEARLQKANTDVTRLTPLVKQQAVSQQELDNALVRPGRGPRPGGRAEGGRRQGDPRPRLHADHGARSTASWARPRSRRATSSAAARARS